MSKELELIAEHGYRFGTNAGVVNLECDCDRFHTAGLQSYDEMKAEHAAHVVSRLSDAGYSILPSGMEVVPKGISTAMGAFAAGSVTKQRVLEDIAYVLTGWRYEDPEDTWAAVAQVARDKGNAALVRVVEESYAAAAADEEDTNG